MGFSIGILFSNLIIDSSRYKDLIKGLKKFEQKNYELYEKWRNI